MTLGNITALVQDDVKRMLAYSSIAHAGYILIAFVIGDQVASASILYYLLVYTFMNIGAFTIVILLGRKGAENTGIESYAGLAGRHPLLALSMSIFLLSLAGIPPLAGFMGKFYVLSAAVKAQYYWLAVIGVLNSVVAVYYYLRVIMAMYFKEATGEFEPAGLLPGLFRRDRHLHLGPFPHGHPPAGLPPHRPEIRRHFHVGSPRFAGRRSFSLPNQLNSFYVGSAP